MSTTVEVTRFINHAAQLVDLKRMFNEIKRQYGHILKAKCLSFDSWYRYALSEAQKAKAFSEGASGDYGFLMNAYEAESQCRPKTVQDSIVAGEFMVPPGVAMMLLMYGPLNTLLSDWIKALEKVFPVKLRASDRVSLFEDYFAYRLHQVLEKCSQKNQANNAHKITLQRQFEVREIGRVDFMLVYFHTHPEHGQIPYDQVVLEFDEEYHRRPGQQEADQERDRKLEDKGYRVVRVDVAHMHDWLYLLEYSEGIAASLKSFLEHFVAQEPVNRGTEYAINAEQLEQIFLVTEHFDAADDLYFQDSLIDRVGGGRGALDRMGKVLADTGIEWRISRAGGKVRSLRTKATFKRLPLPPTL